MREGQVKVEANKGMRATVAMHGNPRAISHESRSRPVLPNRKGASSRVSRVRVGHPPKRKPRVRSRLLRLPVVRFGLSYTTKKPCSGKDNVGLRAPICGSHRMMTVRELRGRSVCIASSRLRLRRRLFIASPSIRMFPLLHDR